MPNEEQKKRSFTSQEKKCYKCSGEAIPLWPVEVVYAGDNSDNYKKMWRVGCEKCDITWIIL